MPYDMGSWCQSFALPYININTQALLPILQGGIALGNGRGLPALEDTMVRVRSNFPSSLRRLSLVVHHTPPECPPIAADILKILVQRTGHVFPNSARLKIGYAIKMPDEKATEADELQCSI